VVSKIADALAVIGVLIDVAILVVVGFVVNVSAVLVFGFVVALIKCLL